MQPSITEYLKWVFQPFFRWWWAAITGSASIAAFFGTPKSGVMISNIGVFIIIFLSFTLIFLTISVIIQGWLLFWDKNRQLKLVSVRRSNDLSSDWIFVISGYLRESNGTLIEISRPLEDTEVPFAIVKVVGTTDKGYYQAIPIWISPGHLRDFTLNKFDSRILLVKTTLAHDLVMEAFRESIK